MNHSEISKAIKEGIENSNNLELPDGFHLDVNMAGCLQLFAEINGTRCWIYATPFYEGADGIALSVETAKAVGEDDTGPNVDARDDVDASHLEQIVKLSEERGELNAADKHDLAYLWLDVVKPRAEGLKMVLGA